MAQPSRVALLMSVRVTDEISMRYAMRAQFAAVDQECKPAVFERDVDAKRSSPFIPFIGEYYASCTTELEPQPVTLNVCWAAMKVAMPGVEYAAVYNADDAWLPGGLDRMLAEADAHPEASLVYGDFMMEAHGRRACAGNVPGPRMQDVAMVPTPGPFALLRVSAVERLMAEDSSLGSPFDPRFPRTFDHALYVRLSTVGPFAFVREPVARYLNRDDSLSHHDPAGIQAERRELQRWAAQYLRNRERFA